MLKKTEFGSEAVVYVRKILAEGNTFAHALGDLGLEEGRIRSYLPPTVTAAASRAFETSVTTTTGVANWKGESELKVSDLISAYLKTQTKHYAVFETFAQINDTSPSLTRLPFFTHRSEVYFYLDSNNHDLAKILDALRSARYYPFIGGLASLSDTDSVIESKQELTVDILHLLASRTKYILVGAYDEEGYLIWES